MKKIFTICLLSFTLIIAGCGILSPHKPTIQQGNIIEVKAVDQLQVGMSKQQVRDLMGSPILTTTFDQNRWEYIYTVKKKQRTTSKTTRNDRI